jgi:hypothetical protein
VELQQRISSYWQSAESYGGFKLMISLDVPGASPARQDQATEAWSENQTIIVIRHEHRRTAHRAQHQVRNPSEHGALPGDHATSSYICNNELCSICGIDAPADGFFAVR